MRAGTTTNVAIEPLGTDRLHRLGAAFLLLLLPSLATELDTSDYTPEPAFTLYLLGGIVITAMLA